MLFELLVLFAEQPEVLLPQELVSFAASTLLRDFAFEAFALFPARFLPNILPPPKISKRMLCSFSVCKNFLLILKFVV